jgi:hypothetical protein
MRRRIIDSDSLKIALDDTKGATYFWTTSSECLFVNKLTKQIAMKKFILETWEALPDLLNVFARNP